MVLLVTGLAKLWSAMGEARVLGVRDPLFGLTFRQLMAGVRSRWALVRGCEEWVARKLSRSLNGGLDGGGIPGGQHHA